VRGISDGAFTPAFTFWFCCLFGLLTFFLIGCGGKPAKKPPPPIEPAVQETPMVPADKRLREAISYYMGTDYKYGGTTKDGLDCSGLVMKAYERVGIKLPRTSELQFQSGKPVSEDELQYGDLLFFNKYCYSKYSYATASIFSGAFPKDGQPCHVGIFIGNGRFIHSTASQGGVTISNLNHDCWKRSIIGIRRYLKE
jgi:cell wall-associated NlpC family hydrolase